jgi:hypothetical protein
MMFKEKKAAISKTVMNLVFGFLGIVIVFYLLGALYPTLLSAGASACSSGLPLIGTFFGTSGGVGWIIMGALLLVAIIIAVIKMSGHSGGKY